MAERRITNAMWNQFGKLPGLSALGSPQLFSRSVAIGQQAFDEGRRIAGEYVVRRVSLGGVAAPGRGTSGWGAYGARGGPPYSVSRQSEPPERRP
ncbi:MAG: hypothetical protein HOV67_18430 [Kribbellaceae bacterium]|nr:hypothetical protein [Kribbellaceae bacterium]